MCFLVFIFHFFCVSVCVLWVGKKKEVLTVLDT